MTEQDLLKNIHQYNLQWRAQDCDEESVLFYHLKEDAIEDFQNHIKVCPAKWIVIPNIGTQVFDRHIISVDNWKRYQKDCLNQKYPINRDDLLMIGITGTNGKTSTATYLKSIFDQNQRPAMTIGTLGAVGRKLYYDFSLTTPSMMDLHKTIFNFQKDYKVFILELSSHALDQDRFLGESLNNAVWTSFSQDHLDYHKSMHQYFMAKCKIFNLLKSDAKTYVLSAHKNLIEKLKVHQDKLSIVTQQSPLNSLLPFMMDNYSLAKAVAEDHELSVSIDMINDVPGRANLFFKENSPIVVDFAHTPDALENLLSGIRQQYPSYKLKVIFGCGGDRDKSKRPLMGQAVSRFADFAYITNDNPRTENPELIAGDIIEGMSLKSYEVSLDRKECVTTALRNLNEQEVLVIAGKGHENTISIMGKQIEYSDIETVEAYLND